jgi:hypothetical protein
MVGQPIYVAIAGTQHYYGATFLKPGQLIHLKKDPDNQHDHEAIQADMIPIGKIGLSPTARILYRKDAAVPEEFMIHTSYLRHCAICRERYSHR